MEIPDHILPGEDAIAVYYAIDELLLLRSQKAELVEALERVDLLGNGVDSEGLTAYASLVLSQFGSNTAGLAGMSRDKMGHGNTSP